MKVNLDSIAERLFKLGTREKIVRDYCIQEPHTAAEFVQQILEKLGQKASENPLTQELDNNEVFEAAVRALASNSRRWSAFLKNEKELAERLSKFQVEEVARRPPSRIGISELLPGQTSNADAVAILKWANLLSKLDGRSYYSGVITRKAEEVLSQAHDRKLVSHELFLCLVAHFTDPSPRARQYKWPGMGFALGSEFLRNLNWNGFKPDRHIKRLLAHWVNEKIDVQKDVEFLKKLIGRRDRELLENLRISLIGTRISPDEYSYSQVDNLIWLLGAYVETKRVQARTVGSDKRYIC